MRIALLITALSLVLGAGLPTWAGEWEISGVIGAEVRSFPDSPAFSGQDTASATGSAFIQPEIRYEWNDGRDRITFISFFRADSVDDRRTHGDIREFNWLTRGEDWDFRIGIGKVFWGVAESRHLIDIVNQTDLAENVNQEEKLGQPMINLSLLGDWGTLNLYVLPGFRERTFPGREARFRGPLPIDTDSAEYESEDEERHVDGAVRYSLVIGDIDAGISYFRGTSREPVLQPRQKEAGLVLVPVYNQISQTGIDVQATFEHWLWKLEAIGRTGHGDTFFASVAGFEYTINKIFGSRADLGLLVEYLNDGRNQKMAPFTPFDDDVFMGARVGFNNEQNASLLSGLILDRETGARIWIIEAERRIGESFLVKIEGYGFSKIPDQDPLHGIRRDSYLGLTLQAYF